MLAPADRHRDLATLDENVVQQLRMVMEEEFADLFNTYLYNVPRELARLTAGLARRDIDTTISAAHAIKGSSANLGAHRLAQLARDMEMLARTRSLPPEAHELLQAISDEFALLKPVMERHRDTP